MKKDFHFIGIGSAGSKMIEFIQQKGIKSKYSIINDEKIPNTEFETNFIEFIPKGEILHRNGEEIRISDMTAKFEIPQKVFEILNSNEKYILFAGLGGYTGTFVTEEIATSLNKNKKDFSIICSIPFRFEGQRRMQYANELKQKIQNNFDCHFLELEQLRTKYGDMSIKDAFEKADEELFEIFDKRINN